MIAPPPQVGRISGWRWNGALDFNVSLIEDCSIENIEYDGNRDCRGWFNVKELQLSKEVRRAFLVVRMEGDLFVCMILVI